MRSEVCNNGEYFAQPKIDGSCYVYEKTKLGTSYLFSRRVSAKTGFLVEKSTRVPHIIEFFDSIVPPGTIMVTEIFYPGKKSRHVTSIMNCNEEKALARQKDNLLHAYVHDILYYDGVCMLEASNFNRIGFLIEKMQEAAEIPYFIKVANYEVVDLDNFINECLEQGYEGAILKHMWSKYVPSKRPAWNFIKFKIEDSYDVVCLGYEPPTKEYAGTTPLDKWTYYEDDKPVTKNYAKGWIGALKIGVYKDEELISLGTVASGLTDQLLEEIKNNPDKMIGKPLLIKAMEPTEENLREKQFIEFRDDINPKECTWEKIFA